MDSRAVSHLSAGPSGRSPSAGVPLPHSKLSWCTWDTPNRRVALAFATAGLSKSAVSAATSALNRRIPPTAKDRAATASPAAGLEPCSPCDYRQPRTRHHYPTLDSRSFQARGVLAGVAAAASAAAAPCPPSLLNGDGGLATGIGIPSVGRPGAAAPHQASTPSLLGMPVGVIELGEGFLVHVANFPHAADNGSVGGGPASPPGQAKADAQAGAGEDAVRWSDTGAGKWESGEETREVSTAAIAVSRAGEAASGSCEGSPREGTCATAWGQRDGGGEDGVRNVGEGMYHPGTTAANDHPGAARGCPQAAVQPHTTVATATQLRALNAAAEAVTAVVPAATPEPAAGPCRAVAAADFDQAREARKQLTRSMRAAATWRQLRELLAENGPSLDCIHLLAAARRLRDVAPQPGRRVAREQALFRTFMAGFMELCRHHLPDMRPAALTGVLYSLAAMRLPPPPEWMADWLRCAARRLCDFGPQELANTTYALGQLGYDPGRPWLESLCEAAAVHLSQPPAVVSTGEDADVCRDFSAPDSTENAAREVGGMCDAAAAKAGTAAAVAEGSGATGARFSAQGLSQLLWGLARLGYTPPERCMAGLCAEVLAQLPHFTAAGLSNALWGVTTLSYSPPASWVARVADACLRLMPTCNSYDLSMSMWALLRLGYTPGGDWLAGFLSASYGQLPSASPEHSARMLWGLARVGLTPPADWVRHWLSLSYVRLLEAQSTSLTTMMWALATLGIRPGRRWLDMLLVAAWEAPLRSFSPPDLAMLMWGLAQCGSLPEEAWMDEFWLVSYKRLPVLSARHLSILLRSCVALGQAPSERWLAGHEAVTLARMYEQSAEGLSLLSYSYGMLERTPCREWFVALYGASVRQEFADFDAMALERLIWGVAKMDPPSDAAPAAVPGWLDAFLRRFASQLNDASYCNLANVLFALALLGKRPGEAWLGVVAARAEEMVEEFGQTTAAKVLWALPRLAPPPLASTTTPSGNCPGDGGKDERQALARLERLLEARMRRMVRWPRAAAGREARSEEGEEWGPGAFLRGASREGGQRWRGRTVRPR